MVQTKWKLIPRECGPFADEVIIAPENWDLDATSVECWYWLLAKSRTTEFRLKRDKIVNDAKIDMLAQVLANTNGMALFYWVMTAREAVAEEANRRELNYAATSPR